MKKTLLLAGVACLFSLNVQASDYMNEMRPYLGLDYAYSHLDAKKDLKIEKDYNSGIVNAGVKMGDYMGLEAYFQQSGQRKNHTDTGKYKSEFYSYGLDLIGYLPFGCEKDFNLFATVGLGDYNFKLKHDDASDDKQRVGYRFGLGASYDITDNWSARIIGRYDYIGMKHIDGMEEFVAGVRYTF